jgi:hypothetical protein
MPYCSRMTLRTCRMAVLALAAPLTLACDLGTAILDPGPPIDITLDFCSSELPVWFAYQNENQPWRVVLADPQGAFKFSATPRASIAFVRQSGSDYHTQVIHTTNLDLEKVSGLACVEEGGSNQINGSVSGLTGSQIALASMSVSSAYLTPGQTNFTLTQLPDRLLDLIASRIDVVGESQHANKTVIRRALDPANGTTLAVVDFASQGVQPTNMNVSLANIDANDFAYVVNNFFSQLGTSHVLSSVQPVEDGTVSVVAIPAASLATGDYHDLFLVASSPGGSVRGAERFFRNPANQGLTLSAPLAEPFVSILASDPHLRMRTQIEGQIDYSTVLESEYTQEIDFSAITISTTVTASFFGATPAAWNIPTPDFAGLEGFEESWALKAGTPVDWTVTAYFGRPQLLFGDKPQEGETVIFGSRSSSIATANAAVNRRPTRRPVIARWY